MPKVSIVIPAYNPGAYLRETLASVHRQTFQDWELVVVNDGSTEDLSWICSEFPKARLIQQENGGASVARNTGILQTTGEYLAFLDQDDIWLPSKLANQVAVMESSAEIAVCYCDLEIFNEEQIPESSPLLVSADRVRNEGGAASTESPLPEFIDEMADGRASGVSLTALHRSALHFASKFVVPSTVMLRRTSLAVSGLLDPFLPFTGDYEMLIKIAAKNKVVRMPVVAVYYRRHANNFSHRYDVCQAELKALAFKFRAFALSRKDWDLAREASRIFRVPPKTYAAQAIDRCRASLRANDTKAFFEHFMRAFYFSPGTVVKSVFQWLGTRFRSYGSATR
ncbi:MAG TPA: glycosyltransferase family 2 protein [Chthoniobacter sp.]|nr:glycosyltransferase family 2 protein [Chthoniobacter sp.]